MRVVAFTGLPGSGKTEAVAVARARGFPVVRMGEYVWEETRRRGLPLVDANVGRVASELRETNGPDYWAQRTSDDLLDRYGGQPLVVVDGVRNEEEVEVFRRRLGPRFELVAVEAPFPLRAERLRRRGRSDDPDAIEEMRQRDEREKGWGLERAMAAANHVLTNTGDLARFRQDVSRLLDRLGAETPPSS